MEAKYFVVNLLFCTIPVFGKFAVSYLLFVIKPLSQILSCRQTERRSTPRSKLPLFKLSTNTDNKKEQRTTMIMKSFTWKIQLLLVVLLCFVANKRISGYDWGEGTGHPYCNVCGYRKMIPDSHMEEIVDIPTRPSYTCGFLEQRSRQGYVPREYCSALQAFARTPCGCIPKPPKPAPTSPPTATPSMSPEPSAAPSIDTNSTLFDVDGNSTGFDNSTIVALDNSTDTVDAETADGTTPGNSNGNRPGGFWRPGNGGGRQLLRGSS